MQFFLGGGARGYVRKSDSDHDVLIAVETLAKHRSFFTRCATEKLLVTQDGGELGIWNSDLPLS